MVQHVLYIEDPPSSMVLHIEENSVSYRYHMTGIRQIDEEVLLQSESAAERAPAVLSSTRDERATMRRILASWAGTSRREQADLVGKLVLLSGLRRLNRMVAEEVHNMPITIDYMENETIRGLIEQGQASLLSKQSINRFGVLTPTVEQ
jgi:Lon protease-like protein